MHGKPTVYLSKVAMKGKLLTLSLVVLFCARTAQSGGGGLLPKVVTPVNATSSLTVNATLDRAFVLSGHISGDSASQPVSIVAESGSLSFPGEINPGDPPYRIVLPAGTYNIVVTWEENNGAQTTIFTATVVTGLVVSSNMTHDITLPSPTTFAVTGTISNLNVLFAAQSVSFTSTTIPGFTFVTALSQINGSGGYTVQLPNGTYTVGLSQVLDSLTTFFSSTLASNLGPGAVSGATTLNFMAPSVTTATLSGNVGFTGSPSVPAGSALLGVDATGGAPPTSVSSGFGSLPTTGAYGFTFQTNRTYALNPTAPVSLLLSPVLVGDFSPPDPGPQMLTSNMIRNVTYPALPGPATAVTISGQVTITGTTTPVANAEVVVNGSQITGVSNTSFLAIATTDAQGSYSVVVPAGTNYTMVFKGGFKTSGDFDGDGNADIGVWRPSNGEWYIMPSSNLSTATLQQWGTTGDIPVRGDFDGDGKTDFAVFRPSTGEWFIIPSSNPGSPILQLWGANGDIPVPGDYDGDGKTDFAIFRPSTGEWYIIPSSNPGSPILQLWGANGDIPVPGDYDGDGKTDFAVFRPSTGEWYIIPSSNPGSPILKLWGANGDIPVPGDYDGDGKTDIAVWRPSTGEWYIIPSSNPSSPILRQWGTVGDIPVPVDYDGDRKTDIAVWRPSTGLWFIIPSSTPATFTITPWGANGDVPLQKPIGQ